MSDDFKPQRHIVSWQFDKTVASRFQKEAINHIPDYQRVIDLSIQVAEKYISKNDLIIDVGSALGHTINEFIKFGFNVVANSY